MTVEMEQFGSGPEERALHSTARGLIIVAAPLAGLMVLPPFLLNGVTTAWSVFFGLFYGVLLVAGLLNSRRTYGLWLLIAAMAMAIPWQLAYPQGVAEYSSIDDIVIFTSIAAIMLSTRWAGLAFAFLGGAITVWIWEFGPSHVVAVAHLIGEGLDSEAQVFSAVILAWWAWNVLRQEAAMSDLHYDAVLKDTQRSAQDVARSRARQEVATVIHESLLNTIRYVFSTPTLNLTLLKEEIERTDEVFTAHDELDVLSLDTLRSAIIDDVPSRTLVQVDIPKEDAELDRDVFRALRGAVAEAVLNAVNHGGATFIEIEMRLHHSSELHVVIQDDGVSTKSDVVEGFGLRHVISTNIESAGGRVHINPGETGYVIEVAVPVVVQARIAEQAGADAFDKARFIVTAALAGLALGGLFYSFALVTEFTPVEWVASVISLFVFLTPVVIVVRRKALTPLNGLALSILVAAVPALLVNDFIECAEVSTVIGLIGATSAAVITVALWTRKGLGTIGFIVWIVASLWLLFTIPTPCRQTTIQSTAYIVAAAPILMVFGYFVMRVFARANAIALQAYESLNDERAQAQAAQMVEAEYSELVNQAQELLREIVRTGSVSDTTRDDLMQVEAKIRAAIQIDPETSSGMAILARDVVNRFANRGMRVRARAFVDSGDRRPVGNDVRDALRSMTATCHEGAVEVQLIHDGTRDILTLKFDIANSSLGEQDVETSQGSVSVRAAEDGCIVVVTREVNV